MRVTFNELAERELDDAAQYALLYSVNDEEIRILAHGRPVPR